MKNKKNYSKSIIGTVLAVSFFLTLCLLGAFGSFGSAISGFLTGFFGLAAYGYALSAVLVCVILLLGGQVFLKKRTIAKYIVLFAILILALHTASSKQFLLEDGFFAYLKACFDSSSTAGGMLMGIITYFPARLLSYPGALILFFLAFIAAAFLSLTGNRVIQGNYRSKKVVFGSNSASLTEFNEQGSEPVTSVGNSLFVETIDSIQSFEVVKNKNKSGEERVVNYEPIDNIFASTLGGSGILSNTIGEEDEEEYVQAPVIDSNSRKQAYDKLFNFKNSVAGTDDSIDLVRKTISDEASAEERLFASRNSLYEKEDGSAYLPQKDEEEKSVPMQSAENDKVDSEENDDESKDSPFFNLVFESNPNAFTNGYFNEQRKKNAEAEERQKNNSYNDVVLDFEPRNEDSDYDKKLGNVLNTLTSDDVDVLYGLEDKDDDIFINSEEEEIDEYDLTPADKLFGNFSSSVDTDEDLSDSKYASPFDRIFGTPKKTEEKVVDVEEVEEDVKVVEIKGEPTEVEEDKTESVSSVDQSVGAKRDFSDITNGNFNMASAQKTKKAKTDKVIPGQISLDEEPTTVKRKPYCAPPLALIPADTTSDVDNAEEHEEYTNRLNQILADFKVEGQVSGIVVGPAFTRYEITLKPGISVTKITGLSKDIAVGLGGLNIRIEAPVPGKTCVGIEIPNRERSTVSLRGVLEKSNFFTAKSPLTVCLGRDISGTSITCDLADMPHLLVAGTTGSGKSVCLNTVLCSILYKSSPEDVRLILVDPKRVELNKYNGLPHMLIKNAITDAPKVIRAMDWLISEMDSRYDLFSKSGVNSIKDYNSKVLASGEGKKLPYILMVIDEIGDLMLVVKNDIEDRIQRLAQLARAAGIHLIVATQRPDVNVITGTIKANLPSRIAFAVTTAGDSTTILGFGGAEKLLGKGDMLFSSRTAPQPVRIQCAFIHNDDVQAVTNYVREKNDAFFDENIEKALVAPATASGGGKNVVGADGEEAVDELFYEVVKYAISRGTISVTEIQRKFKMGFSRAGRVVDQMYDRNFISKQEGSKPREVLITQEQFDELYTGEDA